MENSLTTLVLCVAPSNGNYGFQNLIENSYATEDETRSLETSGNKKF